MTVTVIMCLWAVFLFGFVAGCAWAGRGAE